MHFDFWSPKIISLYESIKYQMNLKNIKSSKTIIIEGDAKSGKTSIVETCLDTIWLNSEFEKKVGNILKIVPEEVVTIYEVKKIKEKASYNILKHLEFTPKLPILGAELSFDLISTIDNYFSSKKIHIIIFENVSLNGDLSVNKVSEILKENNSGKVLSIITTKDEKVRKYINTIHPNTHSFKMPSITYKDYLEQVKLLKEESKTNYESIHMHLRKIGNEERIKEIIELSEGSYGILSFLLVYLKNPEISIETNIDDIFKFSNISDSDLEKVLIPLFLLPKGISVEWLELIFRNSDFDFISYLKRGESKELMIEDNLSYRLSPSIPYKKKDYIKTCSNYRGRLIIAKILGNQVKLKQPENYLLRSELAKLYDKQLSSEYFFLHCIQSDNEILLEDERLKKEHKELLRIIMKKEKISDTLLIKKFKKLNNYQIQEFSTLISSQVLYFQLDTLLKCTYQSRKEVRLNTEITLHKMLPVYHDLIKQEENDLVIKMGLLLIPEMINYLPADYVLEAKKMYPYIEKKIGLLIKQNFPYYKYYDVIYKIKTTSVLNYRVSLYHLWEVVEDFKLKKNPFLNYEKMIPMIISNLLGISFYIDEKEIRAVFSVYLNSKKLVDSFEEDNYKIKNNLILAKFLLNFDKLTTRNDSFFELREHHISAINYAGELFYEGRLGDAENILNEILNAQKNDDFYVFFCNYNLFLLSLFNGKTIEDGIENLIIPSLFVDKKIIKEYEKHINKLKKIEKNVLKKRILFPLI